MGGITFEEIRMAPDHLKAYVRWTCFPGEEQRAALQLEKNKAFLRRKLAKTLPFRRVPVLVFKSGFMSSEEDELESILDSIEAEFKLDATSDEAEDQTKKP